MGSPYHPREGPSQSQEVSKGILWSGALSAHYGQLSPRLAGNPMFLFVLSTWQSLKQEIPGRAAASPSWRFVGSTQEILPEPWLLRMEPPRMRTGPGCLPGWQWGQSCWPDSCTASRWVRPGTAECRGLFCWHQCHPTV